MLAFVVERKPPAQQTFTALDSEHLTETVVRRFDGSFSSSSSIPIISIGFICSSSSCKLSQELLWILKDKIQVQIKCSSTTSIVSMYFFLRIGQGKTSLHLFSCPVSSPSETYRSCYRYDSRQMSTYSRNEYIHNTQQLLKRRGAWRYTTFKNFQ